MGPKTPLAIGIGVHQRPVMIGTVGDAQRREVTAIGDTVNVPARVESLTKALGVVAPVREETLEHAPRELRRALRRLGSVRIKGRGEPMDLFGILDCVASADEREPKEATGERFHTGLIASMQGDLSRT
jgi:class 3 adenylate cyclase